MILADTIRLCDCGPVKPAWERAQRRTLDDALQGKVLAVSAITFWEVAMLNGRAAWIFPRMLGYGAGKCLFKGSRRPRRRRADHRCHALGDALLLTADVRILGWSGRPTGWMRGSDVQCSPEGLSMDPSTVNPPTCLH